MFLVRWQVTLESLSRGQCCRLCMVARAVTEPVEDLRLRTREESDFSLLILGAYLSLHLEIFPVFSLASGSGLLI